MVDTRPDTRPGSAPGAFVVETPTAGSVELAPDDRRLCASCGERPVWSPSANCRLCHQCGRPKKHVARRRESYEEPRGGNLSPSRQGYRERYQAARAAGLSIGDARLFAGRIHPATVDEWLVVSCKGDSAE